MHVNTSFFQKCRQKRGGGPRHPDQKSMFYLRLPILPAYARDGYTKENKYL